jgi:hypothetical protein
LGEEMLRRNIAAVETTYGARSVKTIAGNMDGVNAKILAEKGLQETPAYKMRVAMGFTEVVEAPTAANGYKLVTKRPN